MTKQDIIALLEKNDKAIVRALIVLNERQTIDEQQTQSTSHANGRGFNAFDATMGTSMAEFATKNGFLSPKQVAFWRKLDKRGNMRIAKYANQLLEIAQEKASAMVETMENNVETA